MNTMADGAAQRLVAQIGEALFGQPGLTLMELAEKVKGMNLHTAHAAYRTGKAIGRREAELEAARQLVGENALGTIAREVGAYVYGLPGKRYYDFSEEQLEVFSAAVKGRPLPEKGSDRA